MQLCASIPHELSLVAGPGTGFHLAFGNMSFSSGPDTKVPTTRVRGGGGGYGAEWAEWVQGPPGLGASA